MPNGVIPSVEFNEQLKRFVRENLRRERGTQRQGRWHKKGGFRRKQIQLVAALNPATNFSTAPGTALANVLIRNDAGDVVPLVSSGAVVQITITQRYEHLGIIPAYTYGAAIWQDGEWHLDGIDCDAATGGLLEAEEVTPPAEEVIP
jgi:hypothetical protein